jgi:ADP-ribose pyrophosphatase YjhB (NUDIX family)
MWLLNAKFVVGVTGVVRDDEGRVLVLRHRMWSPARQWGLPSGFARKGEDFRATVVREVKEETGLDVAAGRLVMLNSGLRTRMEVAYEARLLGGELRLDPTEILEARWCLPDDLPERIQPVCHALVRGETTP